MNIFLLHWNPRIAATWHCDKHVVKMIIESAQMLYCAHWVMSPDKLPAFAYKKAHVNHPCTIWVRESYENYMWLSALAWELCREYTHRYGKIHKTQSHIEWLISNSPTIPKNGLTDFRLAMPDDFKRTDPVDAYRTYYREVKLKQKQILEYTRRPWPEFLLKTDSCSPAR
jgi:hypothetical protein